PEPPAVQNSDETHKQNLSVQRKRNPSPASPARALSSPYEESSFPHNRTTFIVFPFRNCTKIVLIPAVQPYPLKGIRISNLKFTQFSSVSPLFFSFIFPYINPLLPHCSWLGKSKEKRVEKKNRVGNIDWRHWKETEKNSKKIAGKQQLYT
ncbi:hypothetical protein AABB24_030138, partial [Solanum stoloniferum]